MPYLRRLYVVETRTKHSVVLTGRDRSILHALSNCVKTFSAEQIKETWWPAGGDPRPRLKRLENAGWIERSWTAASMPIRLFNPLAVWSTGHPEPHWSAIIASARARWRSDARAVSLVSVSEAAAVHFGGVARYPRPSEVSHDLLLTRVFLYMRSTRPRDARVWMGECALAALSGGASAVPDALLRRPGRPVAIEVVGDSYRPPKLRSLHDYCAEQGWGYELW